METLQRTANRGSVSTGYDIDNSLKIEADNAERIQRASSDIGTPTSTQIATMSFWLKRTELASGNHFVFVGNAGANYNWVGFNNNNLYIYGGTSAIGLRSTAVFRDTSAWYHIVVAYDTTQSTASNRVKAYVNGVQITAWGVQEDYGTQNNAIGLYDLNLSHYLGWTDAQSQSGYYAEFYLIDGQQLAPTEFGEFDSDTGIWIPKAYTGSFGNEGYYLDFEDSSNLGLDVSGNSNNFGSLTNISAADQATDTPTNNFCTLNILYNYAYGNTITEGATKIYGAANNWGGGKATFGLTSGKWYWEIKQLANGNTFMGLQTDGEDNISSGNAQSQNTSVVFYTDGTLQYSNGSESTTSASNSIAANSIVGFALDLDSATQTIKVYNNNSLVTAFGSSGTANLSTYNIADKTVFPFVALYDRTVNMNFGGYTVSSISSAASDENGYGTFEYAPPSGYYAMCTKNLAEYG